MVHIFNSSLLMLHFFFFFTMKCYFILYVIMFCHGAYLFTAVAVSDLDLQT